VAARAFEELTGLPAAYARLDSGQREAVNSVTDTVVLAGPGSGKTETLAVKAAMALLDVPAPRGVACITYTRSAAQEIRNRVAELGVRPGRRLVARTLHSFCLREIIRPYAALVGEPELARRDVMTKSEAGVHLADACETKGATVSEPELQVMRGLAVADEDLSDFSAAQINVMEYYISTMADAGVIDFDGMIHEALRLAQEYPIVVELTAARFPWLLVDEYQDLGPSLHVLVQTLRTSDEITVFAVGDPDQTIMQFTGADSDYIESLEAAGYRAVRLPINYRCAPSIVRAAAGALERQRGYKAAPKRTDDGEVLPLEVDGGMAEQMQTVVDELLPSLLKRFKAHEIAILYTGKGWYADRIVEALQSADIPFSLERDVRFSQLGETIGWLQRCAQWSIDAWSERQGRFRQLADDLREYLVDAEHPAGKTSLAAAEFLYPLLEEPVDPDTLLADWLGQFVTALQLDEILKRGAVHAQEREALAELLLAVRKKHAGLPIQAFAGPIRRPGRIVVTTYHSSKGREFDAVILPGLQDGIMPSAWKPRGGYWRFDRVDNDLKLFYVALTRARHSLALLWSPSGENRFGDPHEWPRSRFIDAVLEQL
jgi:DNA helicase-2/ATP-dependent DNA helicase PcrA